MANYKVAQDVEADDKLLGPFGFRQFIYLVIVAMAGLLGYGLWQILPPLAILPSPIIILFGALALPLRKDQPMETYLAAMVSYYLKPRRRLWQPDGVETIVEITAPKTSEESLIKDFSGNEADRRLSYLADIADTRGWAIRHSAAPTASTSMISDIYNEAQSAEDVLDDSGNVAQSITSLIDKADVARRQQAIARINTPQPAPQLAVPVAQPSPGMIAQPVPTLVSALAQPAPQPAPEVGSTSLRYDPYPTIHQSIIQPMSAQPAPEPVIKPVESKEPPQETSEIVVSPDIINLANNSKNLSVETIAHEAKRLHERKSDDEVVISLR